MFGADGPIGMQTSAKSFADMLTQIIVSSITTPELHRQTVRCLLKSINDVKSVNALSPDQRENFHSDCLILACVWKLDDPVRNTLTIAVL